MAWGRLALIEAAKVSPEALTQVAKVFDYEKQIRDEQRKSEGLSAEQRISDEPLNLSNTGQKKRSTGSFVRITKIEPLEPEKEQSHDYLYDPKQQLKADDTTSGTYQFEAPRPLLTSAQLIPFLHNSLGLKHAGNKIDQRVLGRLLSKGQPIQKLPFKSVQRWSQQLQIIVDTGDHLCPYWKDFERMVELLKQVLGSNNVSALRLRESAQRRQTAQCITWPTEQGSQWQTWKVPAADVPVLILSDFGVTEKTGNHSGLWWRFAKDLYFHPAPVVTLSPVASAPLNRAACRRLSISPLRDGISLPRHALAGFDQVLPSPEKIKTILVMLSPLPIIDTGLLRKLRDAFQWGNSVLEGLLWNHPDMQVGSLGIRLKPSLARAYAKQFRCDVSQQDAQKLWAIVEAHHKDAHQGLKQLELIGQSVASGSDNEEVRSYLKKLSASTAQSIKGSAQHNALVMQCKTYLASQPDDIWNGELNDVFYDLCAMAYETDIKAGELPPLLGESFRPERLKWLLDDKERQEYVSWSVRQVGLSGEICFEQASTATEIASPVYRFEALKKIPPTLHRQDGSARSLYDGLVCKTDQLDSVEARTESEVMHFDVMQKPDWAEAIGRDQYGLYADINLTPEHIQRFRWIPAGEFMMGESKNESGLRMKTSQRRVSIPNGFWLADSTVTQAQWRAVMNRKPSKFKGDNRPVERVRLEDIRSFIEKISKKQAALEFDLPNEASWEYACRAGTNTVFSFGNRITTEQVNFKGIYPYQHEYTDLYRDDNGLYREETVPVKSLPANPWGLYEMHGNVAEYCWVYHELDKDSDSLINKFADVSGAVLRGGSWLSDGSFVCSAFRSGIFPDSRESDCGFRLALVSPDVSAVSEPEKLGAKKSKNELFANLWLDVENIDEHETIFPDIELQHDLADKEFAKGNYESALSYLMQALGAQREMNFQYGELVTSKKVAEVLRAQGKRMSGLDVLERTLERAKVSGASKEEAEILTEIAQVYLSVGDSHKSLGLLNEAYSILAKIDDQEDIASLCMKMSNIYFKQGDAKSALKYSELAQSIWQGFGDQENELRALDEMIKIYRAMGDYESALGCSWRVKDLMLASDDDFKVARISQNIYQYYFSMGAYDEAKFYLEVADSRAQNIGDNKVIHKVLMDFSELSVKQGKHVDALEYVKSAQSVAKFLDDEELIELSNQRISELKDTPEW